MISPQSFPKHATFCAAVLAGVLAVSTHPTIAQASDGSPSILVAGRIDPVAIGPYRSRDGTVYASADFVKAMGASEQPSQDGQSVSIAADGRTQVFPCTVRSGQAIVSLNMVVPALGGTLSWDEPSRTATILARIEMVRENADHLTVVTGFPVPYKLDSVDDPERVFMDITGASLGAPETTVPVSGDDADAVKANQLAPDIVRVVVDMRRDVTYSAVASSQPSLVEVAMAPREQPTQDVATAPAQDRSDQAPAQSQYASSDGDRGVAPAPVPAVAPAPLNPGALADLRRADATQHVESITTDASTPGVLRVVVTTDGPGALRSEPYHAFLLNGPDRLVFDIPGADIAFSDGLAQNVACTLPLVNAAAKEVRWGVLGAVAHPIARVVFDLYRPLSYTISKANLPTGAVQYTIDLLLAGGPAARPQEPVNPEMAVRPLPVPIAPAISPNTDTTVANAQGIVSSPDGAADDSALNGKTVVVDPGHGGQDGGAPGVDHLWEKNITLAIGKQLRDELLAAGAKVVMTRADDVFVPLRTRAEIGIENHADFFVSIHADSSGAPNTHEGTTVYYHANLPVCRDMASDIADRLSQLNDGIVGLGTRSDYVRFPGVGFSVLRNSPEPAVLVETGYINSQHDAEVLIDPAMQKLIAEGIVAGLKDFAARNAPHGGSSAAPSTGDLALTR